MSSLKCECPILHNYLAERELVFVSWRKKKCEPEGLEKETGREAVLDRQGRNSWTGCQGLGDAGKVSRGTS